MTGGESDPPGGAELEPAIENTLNFESGEDVGDRVHGFLSDLDDLHHMLALWRLFVSIRRPIVAAQKEKRKWNLTHPLLQFPGRRRPAAVFASLSGPLRSFWRSSSHSQAGRRCPRQP